MKNLLYPREREALIERLGRLNPENSRRWGTMNASQVVQHLTFPLQTATGDFFAKSQPGPFRNPLVAQLTVWLMPWPKGAPTAPEYLNPQGSDSPESFERDRQALLLALFRFVQTAENGGFAEHPLFGPLSQKAWGRLMWRHLDHHLRQFGV